MEENNGGRKAKTHGHAREKRGKEIRYQNNGTRRRRAQGQERQSEKKWQNEKRRWITKRRETIIAEAKKTNNTQGQHSSQRERDIEGTIDAWLFVHAPCDRVCEHNWTEKTTTSKRRGRDRFHAVVLRVHSKSRPHCRMNARKRTEEHKERICWCCGWCHDNRVTQIQRCERVRRRHLETAAKPEEGNTSSGQGRSKNLRDSTTGGGKPWADRDRLGLLGAAVWWSSATAKGFGFVAALSPIASQIVLKLRARMPPLSSCLLLRSISQPDIETKQRSRETHKQSKSKQSRGWRRKGDSLLRWLETHRADHDDVASELNEATEKTARTSWKLLYDKAYHCVLTKRKHRSRNKEWQPEESWSLRKQAKEKLTDLKNTKKSNKSSENTNQNSACCATVCFLCSLLDCQSSENCSVQVQNKNLYAWLCLLVLLFFLLPFLILCFFYALVSWQREFPWFVEIYGVITKGKETWTREREEQ